MTLVGENVRCLVPLGDAGTPAARIDPAGMEILPAFSLYRPLPAIYRLRSGVEGAEQSLERSDPTSPLLVFHALHQAVRDDGPPEESGAERPAAAASSDATRSELTIVVFFNRQWVAYFYDT